jgi:hypothetical protein
MKRIFGLWSLLCAVTVAVAQTYTYDARIGFGMAVPPTWQKLTRAPQGYPINNFLFGWQRTVDGAKAVLVVTVVPIVTEGTQPAVKQPTLDLGWLEATMRDYFAVDQGALVTAVSRITLAGKPAVAIEAVGIGNGIAINPRIGQERTKVLCCVTFLSPTSILRVQYGAPEWLFNALAPEVRAALSTAHFGPPPATPPAIAETVPSEVLQEAIKKATVQPLPAPAIAELTATAVKEQSILAPEQWKALEALARAKGISVGALLRQIVDEYIQKHAQPLGEQKEAEKKETEKGKE